VLEVRGAGPFRIVILTPATELLIGRRCVPHLALPEPELALCEYIIEVGIGGRHKAGVADIAGAQGGVHIRLNGRPLSGRGHRLHDGDRLDAGTTRMVVRL
jgi:hypothetical protein